MGLMSNDPFTDCHVILKPVGDAGPNLLPLLGGSEKDGDDLPMVSKLF